ncbi:hypothetical protein L3N51_01590 [Metallosphaera sp. J1]|uniref:hypothetical protein n=1 Tax=Metallosphaera javensis (ex Hofmann et al. 2022) TaxID=99938 RepID=UPI001EE11C2B|nr:hypothetical protein [Metallosphaera javensis (ex Hofmann et al. 2022)]MCG3109300.1 hypothetical protein [Metallosphaera javensis (ex Hofmann et al. 2022)]
MPKIEDLPCSAKLVYKILELKGKATFQELKTETYMPERTLREALRILRDADLLSVEPCLGDTRSRVYSLSDVCVGLTGTERRKVED